MNRSTPFNTVLIANRGEIALRVMRSARRLGYRTVAVYSSADARARHVIEADQAVCIGEPQPARSYLNIPAIIDAARRTGADAVHPGYGFLAENADFAKACRDAGLVFIGPSPEAIVAMGHKAGAKDVMQAAGVPCVPGYQGADQSEGTLQVEADRIGYPVMIKAVAGGGGRGMRLVESSSVFLELLRSAQSEARNAFGDGTVILERAIVEPRHIEIQVFADRHGNAIHLGERDCSVQRRHQKVIEEAPSPAVTPALRQRMGQAAVAAVKAIGYEGAGTLEFLLDRAGNFYFMEMNTRLQVEHPVTEAITGLDLVELQLRVAAGEALPLTQEAVCFDGHAIEVRLCAEDAEQGFMPQSGTMTLWRPAAGLRVEHALRSGSEIPPYYDSMIAKVIAHGRTRDEARRVLTRGLEETVALGVKTNQAFLRRCLTHPVFAAGEATTAFIGQQGDALMVGDVDVEQRAMALAAVLLQETTLGERQRGLRRSLAHGLPVRLSFDLSGKRQQRALLERTAHCFEVDAADRRHEIEMIDVDGERARFLVDGVMEHAWFHRDGDRLGLHYAGRAFDIVDTTRITTARHDGSEGSDGKLRASMNGRVVALLVSVGDEVAAGSPVLAIEAMKMEHVHVAPAAGRVMALHVALGEQVQARRVVAEIQPLGAKAD